MSKTKQTAKKPAAKTVALNAKVEKLAGKLVAKLDAAAAAKAAPTPLTGTVKIGTKVRVLDMKGKPSKKIYTILKPSKDEPVPGKDWFAFSPDLFAHRSDLIAA